MSRANYNYNIWLGRRFLNLSDEGRILIDPSEMVLYMDGDLLVVNKPAGLLAIPDGYDQALPHLNSILEPEFGRLITVHRLDRGTSGVVVIARNSDAHRILNSQFQKREVEKTYHALVFGSPGWDEISVNLPLRKNGDRHHRTIVDHRLGKKAATHFTVKERFDKFTMIEAHPHSGYTHQIRAHLTHLGFPLVGDELYYPMAHPGQSTPDDHLVYSNLIIARMALHACSITLSHPLSGERVTFSAPYPNDFQDALALLRQNFPRRF